MKAVFLFVIVSVVYQCSFLVMTQVKNLQPFADASTSSPTRMSTKMKKTPPQTLVNSSASFSLYKSHGENEQPTQPPKLPEKVDIVHLYNPFSMSYCNEKDASKIPSTLSQFCPYDQGQSLAMASLLRAQAYARTQNISVVLAAVGFQTTPMPAGFYPLPVLTRSTATEYPNLTATTNLPPRQLPFVQDIFDALLQTSNTSSTFPDYDHVVYTNSDILLKTTFYKIVMDKLHEGYQAFTINRQAIPTTKMANTTTAQQQQKQTKKVPPEEKEAEQDLFTTEDLDFIDTMTSKAYPKLVKNHPGYDCFVFSRKLLGQLDMGKVFVGYPPQGVALLAQVMHHVNATSGKFRKFTSFELSKGQTFHLGNDGAWRNGVRGGNATKRVDILAHQAYTDQNKGNADALPIFWRGILGRHRPNYAQKKTQPPEQPTEEPTGEKHQREYQHEHQRQKEAKTAGSE